MDNSARSAGRSADGPVAEHSDPQLPPESYRGGQAQSDAVLGGVVSEDGSEPGLVQYLLLREAAILLPLAILLKFLPLIGGMLSLVAASACILMMFMEDSNRRTGQDMLAKTLVIRD